MRFRFSASPFYRSWVFNECNPQERRASAALLWTLDFSHTEQNYQTAQSYSRRDLKKVCMYVVGGMCVCTNVFVCT
jgi:hypothetical protein